MNVLRILRRFGLAALLGFTLPAAAWEIEAGIGLIDGTSGRLEATVDGLPMAIHEGIVNLLVQAVRKGLG